MRARRYTSLLLLLPFALGSASAQSVTDADEPAAATVEQVAAPASDTAVAPAVVAESAAPAQDPAPVEVAPDMPEDAVMEAVTESAEVPQPAVEPAAVEAPVAAAAAAPVTAADAPGEAVAAAPSDAASVPAAASSAVAPVVVAAPAAPSEPVTAPAPDAPPVPRPLVVPVLANENNAIERQLGARCPNDLAARLATQDNLLIGACQGTMPAHLANVLKAIPEQQLLLPRAARERQVSQKAWFKAVPGYGQRPDFLAVQNGMWVRSFEGADPATTVYLVS
ncbi:MAG: hypothetical protein ACREPC_03565, partial [Stenotrophomonas sp.]